jgi:hypothetical protein
MRHSTVMPLPAPTEQSSVTEPLACFSRRVRRGVIGFASLGTAGVGAAVGARDRADDPGPENRSAESVARAYQRRDRGTPPGAGVGEQNLHDFVDLTLIVEAAGAIVILAGPAFAFLPFVLACLHLRRTDAFALVRLDLYC